MDFFNNSAFFLRVSVARGLGQEECKSSNNAASAVTNRADSAAPKKKERILNG